MADALDRCDLEACRHAFRYHRNGGPCRVTGCSCTAFREERVKRPTTRRVAIDVPDGYTLSFSLIPWSPSDAAPADEPPAEGTTDAA